MTTAIVVVVLVACVAAAVGVFLMTRRIRDSAVRSNEIIPGQPTNAPASWAGSHDPEARLHRRIRDALALLRADPKLEYDGERIDARVRIELAATDLDNWLIAVSTTPPRLRETALAHADSAVTELENVAAALSGGATVQHDRVDELITRISSPPALDA
ncbi:hypothetical protein [Williamsia muralis]|uniref:hypothetical protein n=1 Tax=Williamsia marianensis TaxID=85044 RepID=UPI000DE5CB90|nr:hypothetical protein [Williamsia marianensis]PVY32788.1 hypothetical protein C7458_102540 [Williamsia marianensis]